MGAWQHQQFHFFNSMFEIVISEIVTPLATTNLFHHLNRYRPKQNSESMSLQYHASVSLSASSQQTSPTASTSQTSLCQSTLTTACSAITPYEK